MRYRVDPQASRFTARAFAGGPFSGVGHSPTFAIRELRGEVEFEPESPAASSLRLVAGAGSLSVSDEVSDKDRREIERVTRDEVLESGRFPDITYECPASGVTASGAAQLALAGTLTLHGVSRPLPLKVTVYPMGNTLRAQGEATLRQSEFGIKPVSVAGGMLKVKDEVKLSFDVLARQVPNAAPEAGQADAESVSTGSQAG